MKYAHYIHVIHAYTFTVFYTHSHFSVQVHNFFILYIKKQLFFHSNTRCWYGRWMVIKAWEIFLSTYGLRFAIKKYKNNFSISTCWVTFHYLPTLCSCVFWGCTKKIIFFSTRSVTLKWKLKERGTKSHRWILIRISLFFLYSRGWMLFYVEGIKVEKWAISEKLQAFCDFLNFKIMINLNNFFTR